MRLALVLLAALTAAACASGPDVGPPADWQTDGAGRYWAPGADTEIAFRDLSSLDAMGVANEDSEFVRWAQENHLIQLYRSNPEVVDSVFNAEFADRLRQAAATQDDTEATDAVLDEVKRDFYQRYNNARKGETTLAVPDSLARLSGQVVLDVFVQQDDALAAAGDAYPFVPVAVQVVEGTGTGLDVLAAGDAARARYTSAWVRETAGRSAGTPIDNWVRITRTFGG